MRRTNSLEKTLMLGRIEGKRRRVRQRIRWLDGITDVINIWVISGSWWWTGRPGMLQSWGCKESDTTEQLDWTELTEFSVGDCLVHCRMLSSIPGLYPVDTSNDLQLWWYVSRHHPVSSGEQNCPCLRTTVLMIFSNKKTKPKGKMWEEKYQQINKTHWYFNLL